MASCLTGFEIYVGKMTNFVTTERNSIGLTAPVRGADLRSADEQDDTQCHVTFLTSLLPYPVDNGGTIVTESWIKAIAARASLSIVVLTAEDYSEALISDTQSHYKGICRSLVCHRFESLSPNPSPLSKGWDYVRGEPRHGFWNREADQILQNEMKKSGAEVLWCNATVDAKYLRSAKRAGYATVLSTHNVESEIIPQQQEPGSTNPAWITAVRSFDMRRLEKFGIRWADVVTAITDVDLSYYARLKKDGRAFLMPFACSCKTSNEAGRYQQEANTICFIGSMDWGPNVAAAEYLVGQVMPSVWSKVPDAMCYLVGRNPTSSVRALAGENVIVTGRVPAVSEYYDRAAVIVVPVRDVGGLKIKLVEAMAAGKAIVTTSPGRAGLDVEAGKQLMIADDPADFATAIIGLLENKAERERLALEAQRFVIDRLSPEIAQRQVGKILAELLSLRERQTIVR